MSLRVLSRKEAELLIARGWKIIKVRTVPIDERRACVEWDLYFGERPCA